VFDAPALGCWSWLCNERCESGSSMIIRVNRSTLNDPDETDEKMNSRPK